MKTALTLLSAIAVSAMPTAFANVPKNLEPQPYSIFFTGTLYPADLDTMEYPVAASSRGIDGACTLTISATQAGDITDLSIVSCSHPWFEDAAKRFIASKDFAESAKASTETHSLSIVWELDN